MTKSKLKLNEMGFTPESLEFYTERYKEVEGLYNTLING